MTYPVRLILDEGNLTIRIAEVREWLRQREIDPGSSRYRLATDRVELRIDFTTLRDAARFAEAFDGLVFGSKRSTPTATETTKAEGKPPDAA